MKALFVLLVVAVVAAVAHPDRERRSVLGVPLVAPATTLIGPALGGTVLTTHGHGATVVTAVHHPLGHALVAPGVWGW